MNKIMKNKMISYIVIALIILVGIAAIFAFKLNFTLMYSEHITINVYLGKAYNIQEIKPIVEETLGKQETVYQEIETFGDSLAITVKEATDEQISNLESKLKEKYEIESTQTILQMNKIGHLRGRDIVKPYVVPMLIATIIVLVYIGIRYSKLGVLKTVSTLLLRLIVIETLLLSIIAIFRISIGVYTMPVAILLYMGVILFTTISYENKLAKKIANEKSK
ncbi:MAG: hypothetical protein HFJ57_05595 [Clostridia bacterium]|nr:hypothetical protein [Clostridia bacterium]